MQNAQRLTMSEMRKLAGWRNDCYVGGGSVVHSRRVL